MANVDSDEWWRDSFIYQIFIQSFKDSDGDGIGDLNGITSKLDYLKDLGVSAVWITPFFKSPMEDYGYDITDYKEIDPLFGTGKDFKNLIATAKSLGIKVILDFVPNHTSHEHPWFQKSIQRIKPFDDYYFWVDPKIVNGTRQVPNNWLSVFHGTAWTWNEQRQQYYYHAFTKMQPDLNFRSKHVQNEMEDILRFWLNQGVDGFRIDTLPSLIEDAYLRDDLKRPDADDLPDTDYYSLYHNYTYNPTDTYPIMKSWKNILNKVEGAKKILLTEAYVHLREFDKLMKYYQTGAEIPMNFLFIEYLSNKSSAIDYQNVIDYCINLIPEGHSANWVTSNHDRSRIATRLGKERADQLSSIATVLPGNVVIYQGDEIGMENRPMTWEETKDPPGCNSGPSRYNLTSRDPVRSPFQWDDTISAGFSTNSTTWLPVHPNYKELNVAAQKHAEISHYHVFKKLVALKKNPVIIKGTTNLTVVGDNVLTVVRRLSENFPIILLINFNDIPVTVNATTILNLPEKMIVYVASVGSHIQIGQSIFTNRIDLPPAASVILHHGDSNENIECSMFQHNVNAIKCGSE